MIILATIIHVALPILWIVAMGRFVPRRGLVWTVVAGLTLYESSLLFFGFLLGYLGLLRAPGPLFFWGVVSSALLAFAVRGVRPIVRAVRAALGGVHLGPLDAPLALAAVIVVYR